LSGELLVQARASSLDSADADMTLLGNFVDAEIIAMHGAAVDQLCQLVARVDAAAPGIGVVVDAGLVEFGRVDAVEPVGDVAELDGVAVGLREQLRVL
jgi:hypothetical protein